MLPAGSPEASGSVSSSGFADHCQHKNPKAYKYLGLVRPEDSTEHVGNLKGWKSPVVETSAITRLESGILWEDPSPST